MHANNHIPASYLVLFDKNKILLLKRINTGYEDGNYSMIAGHVDPNETFTQCIIREAKEEAGINIQEKDLKVIHVLHRNSHMPKNNARIDIFFTTSKWKGEIKNIEPHKCEELAWFDINKVPENTIPFLKDVIKKIKDKTLYSEMGWEN